MNKIIYSNEYNVSRNKKIGILFFSFGLYSIGTISSITSSWTITLLFLGISGILLIMDDIHSHSFYVPMDSFIWLISIAVCFVQSVRNSYYQDVVVYLVVSILFFYLSNADIEDIISFRKPLVFFSFVFAFGEYWQYLFPNAYYRYIFPLFPSAYQKSIRRQFYFHKMCTGFSSQTVISAEYIIIGMLVLYCMRQFVDKTRRMQLLCIIILLFIAMCLTGKRSSLLFVVLAYLFSEFVCSPHDRRFRRVLKILIVGLVILIVAYFFVLPNFAGSRNSLVRILEYVQDDEADVTNGRMTLYNNAFNLFFQNPLFGIGWGGYKKIFNTSGAHNVYLQLLCECGIVGTIPIVALFVYWFGSTLRLVSRIDKQSEVDITGILKFSVFSQFYFLVYCMVGNPLYDYSFHIWYIVSIGAFFSCRKAYENRLKEQVGFEEK